MTTRPEASVLKDGARGIMPRCAGDAPAGMRAGAAQVEALERHAVVGRANHGPCAEQLIETHLPVEDVASDQSEASFKVERRVDLPAEYGLREARRMAVHCRNDRVGGFLPFLVPAAARSEIVAKVLAEE